MRWSWNKPTIIVIVPIVSLLLYITFLSIIRIKDASNEPTHICNKALPGNVWLISYADGNDVHFKNQRYLIQTSINKCINFYKPYNANDIDPAYKKAHANILSQKRGAGYWLWKPYVILKTLEEIPEDDIVVYIDSGASLLKPIDSLVNHLADHEILLYQSHVITEQII